MIALRISRRMLSRAAISLFNTSSSWILWVSIAIQSPLSNQTTKTQRSQRKEKSLCLCGLKNLSSKSMRQCIDNIVDAEFIGLIGLFNGAKRIIGELPEIADVIVVVDNHHQPPGIIFQAPELRPLGLPGDVSSTVDRLQIQRLDRK